MPPKVQLPSMTPSNDTVIDQDQTFRQLLMTQVRQACTEISIYTRTLEFDAFGQALLSELEYSCQRGVLVRCLLDSAGSQRFIRAHSALSGALQTQFRVTPVPALGANFALFDRVFAIIGTHKLHDTARGAAGDISHTVAGAAASDMAAQFEARWAAASTWQAWLNMQSSR